MVRIKNTKPSIYEGWSKEQLDNRINEYWLIVYELADKRDDKELLRVAFAIKQLIEYRDIKA